LVSSCRYTAAGIGRVGGEKKAVKLAQEDFGLGKEEK
jgi:hypothetical protein